MSLQKIIFSFKLNLRRFENRIHSCGTGLCLDIYIFLLYIIFSFSDPQIAFSSWLLLAKACKSDFLTHTSESEMPQFRVLQSLEGGTEQCKVNRLDLSKLIFFQKQHGGKLVPGASLLNHSLWDRDGDRLHKP